MLNTNPQTTANQLIVQLSNYSLENPPNEFEKRRFFKEADKLKNISPIEGWVIEGIIYSLINNYNSSVKAFENALALRPHNELVIRNYSTSLIKFGLFEKSYLLVKEHLDYNHEILPYIYEISIGYGFFSDAIIYQKELTNRNQKIPKIDQLLNNIQYFCKNLEIDINDFQIIYLCVLNTIYSEKEKVIEVTEEMEPPYFDSLTIFFGIHADADKICDIEYKLYERLAKLNISAIDNQKVLPIISYV